MKKILKLLLAVVLALAILGGVMFLIDCSNVKSGKEPLFAKEISLANDGGTIEYMGLGYKIIDFNRLNGYDETKVGLWYIKYEDFEEEYKKLDKDIVIDNSDSNNNEDISGDIINNDDLLSGDAEIIDVPSGEVISGDIIDNNEENVGELPTEGQQESINNAYYFNATVIGVNGNNLVVQALEDEAINASADMFSFKLPSDDATSYLIGQKVKIEYTGTIRESYPAQIG